MQFRLKVLAPVVLGVVALLPSSSFAQQSQPLGESSFCGSVDLPMLRSGELRLAQPDTMGMEDQGVINYSAVRGSIVHMEGDLVLLHVDQAGFGNAAPNKQLAGDTWSVVRLPGECSPSDFHMGAPMIAVGTPTPEGILNAVEVGQTG